MWSFSRAKFLQFNFLFLKQHEKLLNQTTKRCIICIEERVTKIFAIANDILVILFSVGGFCAKQNSGTGRTGSEPELPDYLTV